MPEGKILSFPVSEAALTEPDGSRGEQLDLFAGAYEKIAAIVFISLEGVDQNVLLASLAKHSIKTIIDLRGRPVFPRPRFNHKFMMHYFYQRSMDYIECAMSRSPDFDSRNLGRRDECDRLDRWISSEISLGITACIVDAVAIDNGVVAAFRHRVAGRNKNLIEVHPRALI